MLQTTGRSSIVLLRRPALLVLVPLALSVAAGVREGSAADLRGRRVAPITSIEAEAELARARRLLEGGQGHAALMLLQDLLERHGNVAFARDDRFVPLARHVSELLASLPDELLEAYEILYGPAAERLYEEAIREGSVAKLRAAARRYFCTAAGARALSALASAEMDAGRYGAALVALRRLDDHPAPPAGPAATAARKLTCLAALGRRDEADLVLADLTRRGIAELRAGPRRWLPGDYARALFEDFGRAPPMLPRASDWAMPAGNSAGNAVAAPLRITALAPLRAQLPDPVEPEPDSDLRPRPVPLCVDGTILAARGGAIFAFSAGRRGAPELKWSVSGPGPLASERGAPPYVPLDSLEGWLTYCNQGQSLLTCADGRLFCVGTDPSSFEFPTRSVDMQMANVTVRNELQCRSAASGDLLWRFSPENRKCWFFTAPTVAGGRAYSLALEGGTTLLALCLDARTGTLLWERALGRIEAIETVYQFAFEVFFYDACPPSVSGGTVVFPTGQGLVAACDADSGDILWLADYPSRRVVLAAGAHPLTVPVSRWVPRPPVITADVCLLCPTDSEHLLALDLGTGEVRWTRRLETAYALLGAAEGRAYVQADAVLCLDLADGRELWRSGAGLISAGRGVLGEEIIYVPTPGGLERIERASGRRLAPLLLPDGTAPEGNLALVEDALIVASTGQVLVCPARERAALAARGWAADQPGAWQRQLHLGATLMRFGMWEEAGAALTRALDLAPDEAKKAKARHALALCHALRGASLLDREALEQARRFGSDEPNVRKALAEARLKIAMANTAAGNGLARSYLAACRDAGAVPHRVGPTTASYWLHLAQLVREAASADPTAREAFEGAFASLIDELHEEGQVESLARLARWAPFEHSRSAAMLRAADLWARDRPATAHRALAEILATRPGSAAARSALRMLENRGNREEGLPQTPTAAGDRHPRSAVLTHVPDHEVLWSVEGMLLDPLGELTPPLDRCVPIIQHGRLSCLDPRTGDPIWGPPTGRGARHSAEESRPPRRLLQRPAVRATDGVLVAATPHGLLAARASDGQSLWQTPLGPAVPPQEPTENDVGRRTVPLEVAEPHLPPGVRRRRELWHLGRCAACLLEPERGTVRALDSLTGERLLTWKAQSAHELAGAVALTRGMKLFALLRHPPRLVAFDLLRSRELARWELRALGDAYDLRVSAGGLLMVAGPEAILVLDADSMQIQAVVPVPERFRYFLHAGDRMGIIATDLGDVIGFDAETGRRVKVYAPPDEPDLTPVRSYVEADRIWHFETVAGEGLTTVLPDPRPAARGFAITAVAAPQGRLLWRSRFDADGMKLISPPVDAASVLVVRLEGRKDTEFVGVDKESGAEAFRIRTGRVGSDLRFAPSVPLVRDDVLIVGGEGHVVAFGPSEVSLGRRAGGDGE